jgi:hypothetical protein
MDHSNLSANQDYPHTIETIRERSLQRPSVLLSLCGLLGMLP